MPLEGPITDLSDLNPAWPVDSPDQHAITDDNLRKCKDAAKKSFLSMGNVGGVATINATEFNSMQGVTSNVQTQLTEKLPSWVFFNGPGNAYFANEGDNIIIDVVNTGFNFVRLPNNPQDGTSIRIKEARLTLQPQTDYVLQVTRQGVDTITDLETQAGGVSVITLTRTVENRTWFLVYFDFVWYLWPLKGEL